MDEKFQQNRLDRFLRWLPVYAAIGCFILFVVLFVIGYALSNDRVTMYAGFTAGSAITFGILAPVYWATFREHG
jgi:hypothetical protein